MNKVVCFLDTDLRSPSLSIADVHTVLNCNPIGNFRSCIQYRVSNCNSD
jgi:hypothetical protein